MDPTRTVCATERTWDAGRMDGRTEGQMTRRTDGQSETNIPPQTTSLYNQVCANSMAPGRCDSNLKAVIFKHILQIKFVTTYFISGECRRKCLMIGQHYFR